MTQLTYSKKNTVFVIYGGYTQEASVSMRSGRHIIDHLDTSLFSVYEITFFERTMMCVLNDERYTIDLNTFSFVTHDKKTISPDYCFIAVHGAPGENGQLQSLFELIGVPYFSVKSRISALTNHKYHSVCCVQSNNVCVAKNYYINTPQYNIDVICEKIGFPFFIKACKNGSSIGVSKAYSKEQADQLIKETLKIDDEIIIEQSITGREFTMGIFTLDNQIIITPPSEELLNENNIDYLSHENKVDSTKNITVTVADVDDFLLLKMQNFVRNIYDFFGSEGVMRIDFILNQEDNELYFLEINTIPGMSPQSIFPKMLVAAGMTFEYFLSRTIHEGIEKSM
ncbi:MAG: hypothetical protein RLZZ384_695 [Pseudomonadota bacterium]